MSQKRFFSMGCFPAALWLNAPVAVHAHHVLLVNTLPLTPRDPDSDPDKLQCLRAAPSSAANISSHFYPIPWRAARPSVCWYERGGFFPPALPLDRFPWRSQLSDHYMWGLGPGLHRCQNNHFIPTGGRRRGGTWASPTLDLCLQDVGELEMLKTNADLSTGCMVVRHGCSSLFIRLVSRCVWGLGFFWQWIRAVSD